MRRSGRDCLCLSIIRPGCKPGNLGRKHRIRGRYAHTTAKSPHNTDLSMIKSKPPWEMNWLQYADANQWAIHEIKRISDKHDIQCDYVTESAYIFTQEEKQLQKIEKEVNAAADLGIKASFVDSIPFNMPIKGAVRFDDQARFHPLKFGLGVVKYVAEQGVQIFENSRAIDTEENDGYVVTTSQGKRVTAKKVIIATHYPFYNKHGMYFARIYTERAYALAIKAKEKFPGGMYINADDPARSMRNQETQDGEIILVIGDHHKTGQGMSMVKHYEALVDFANTLFTVQDIPYRWSTRINDNRWAALWAIIPLTP